MTRRTLRMEALEAREVPSTTPLEDIKTDPVDETTTDDAVMTDDETVIVEEGETTAIDDDVIRTLEDEVPLEATTVDTGTALPPVTFGPGNFEPLGIGSKYVLVSGLKSGEAHLFGFDANGQLVDTGKNYTPFPGDGRRLSAVRGAVGDVNGDDIADLAFVSGPSMTAMLRVVDGKTGNDLVPSRLLFGNFFGGANVSLADLDADGNDEIIVSPDAGGGPRVRVFSVVNNQLITQADFFGIDDTDFRGGVRTATGDLNGDGKAELLVAAGIGGGPRVAVFDGSQLKTTGTPARLIEDFFVLPGVNDAGLRNGVYISAGDFNADGYADVVVGAGPGGGPQIYALDGKKVLTDSVAAQETPLASYFAYESRLRSGVRVAVKDVNGDGKADLITGTGEAALTQVKTYGGASLVNQFGDPEAATSVDPFAFVKNAGRVASGVFVG